MHLGVLMIVNTEVGLCHPPLGLNLYIAPTLPKMGIGEVTIAVLPWLRDAGVLGLDHLCAGDLVVAAQAARHDLNGPDYILVRLITLTKL